MKKLITLLMMAFAVVAVSCADEEAGIVDPPTPPVNFTAAQVEAKLGGLILTGDALSATKSITYVAGKASGLVDIFTAAKTVEDLRENLVTKFNALPEVNADSYVDDATVVVNETDGVAGTIVLDEMLDGNKIIFDVTFKAGTKKVSSGTLKLNQTYTFTVTDGVIDLATTLDKEQTIAAANAIIGLTTAADLVLTYGTATDPKIFVSVAGIVTGVGTTTGTAASLKTVIQALVPTADTGIIVGTVTMDTTPSQGTAGADDADDGVFTFSITAATGYSFVSGAVLNYEITLKVKQLPAAGDSTDVTLTLAVKTGETELGTGNTKAKVNSVVDGMKITSTGIASVTQEAIFAAAKSDVAGLDATAALDITDFTTLLGKVAIATIANGEGGTITEVKPKSVFTAAGGTVSVIVTAEDGTTESSPAIEVEFVFTAGTVAPPHAVPTGSITVTPAITVGNITIADDARISITAVADTTDPAIAVISATLDGTGTAAKVSELMGVIELALQSIGDIDADIDSLVYKKFNFGAADLTFIKEGSTAAGNGSVTEASEITKAGTIIYNVTGITFDTEEKVAQTIQVTVNVTE